FHFPRRILRLICLGAHPDDIEIGCGATLLSLAETLDLRATHVVATGADGERREEAVKAAALFLPGAASDVHVLGFRDGYLPNAWADLKQKLEQIAVEAAADLVFAPRLDDAHQDHRV